LGLERGAPRYALAEPLLEVRVDPSVGDPRSYRPEIACAVMEGMTLDEEALKIVMKLQENLHWAIGRNRKQASIGVYDLDAVEPDLIYTTEDPDAFRFAPLGAAGAGEAPTLRGILENHPKGAAFAHLLRDQARYPILKDVGGHVLSMPPIINSEATRVTARTRRLFIDVTGLTRRTVSRTLNIIVTSLLENLPGAAARAVEIVGPGPGERRRTPDLAPQEAEVDPQRAARVLGVEIGPQQAVELLERMRHDARLEPGGRIRVLVPAYRHDILHPMDLVEDIAIAYGYHRIVPSLVPTFTVGGERPIEALSERARSLLCGLGFQEVMTLPLTHEHLHDLLLGRQPSGRAVRIDNPVSSEQTMVRTELLPGLLDTLRRNVTHPLPQMIFEVGEVTLLDGSAETGARDLRRLACGLAGARAGFEDIKAVAEAILREFALEASYEPCARAPFLEGRAAAARIGDRGAPAGGGGEAASPPAKPAGDGGASGEPALYFGEVDPAVLERFGIQNPVVLLEADLERLGGLRWR
ncbi:MAG: phenylalanine--tRNA ligase subunit beta, partial [Candidatus Eisenbacteria bacterium]|nr:phenylalanine--tRNA ligase subunit beta [Candidatus Eisenbacteria bacterium]